MELKEYTDKNVCINLDKMLNNEIKQDFYLRDEKDKDGKPYKWQYVISKVRSICKNTIKNDGVITNRYNYGSHMKDGRQYSKNSVQGLPNKLRRILTAGILRDYDMNCCHPSVLLHLVKEHNKKYPDNILEHSCLTLYVNDRQDICHVHGVQKEEMLIALNSDRICTQRKTKGSFFCQNEFVKKFWYEKTEIFNRFNRLQDYKFEPTSKDNPKSSYVNKILCRHENIFLMEAYEKIKKAGYEPSVLMFDGLMVKQSLDDQTDLLAILNKDSIIGWSEKTNETPYDFKETELCKYTGSYAEVKESFEKDNFQIIGTDKYYHTMNINGEMIDYPMNVTSFKSHSKMYKYINHDPENKRGEYCNFFDEWEGDTDRRFFYDQVFNPYVSEKTDNTSENLYNTFRPFKSQLLETTVDDKEVEYFTEFLKTMICNEDEDKYTFLIKYLATLIQQPGLNQRICFILRGSQGCGKDTLAEFMTAMYGRNREYLYSTANLQDIYGDFTTALENKLIVVMSEVTGKDGNDLKDRIKDFVTRPVNCINAKFCKPFQQKNMCNVWLFTNNINPFPLDASSRREVIFKTGEKHRGDKDYFDNLYKKMDTPDEMNKLFTWLYNYDCGDFVASSKKDRPVTQEFLNLQESTIAPEIQYFQYICANKFEDFDRYSSSKTAPCITASFKEFYESGNQFLKDLGYSFQVKASRWKLMALDCEGCKIQKINGTPKLTFEPTKFQQYINRQYPDEETAPDKSDTADLLIE